MSLKGFGSDNHSGVHPKILAAIVEANQGHAHSYGSDPWSDAAYELFKEHLHHDARVFFVWNGTGANIVALRALMKSTEAAIATNCSHLHLDECGAPEFHTGGKLLTVPHNQGKICLNEVEALLIRKGDQHFSQPRVLSITQPTELGTVYSVKEMLDIRQFCDHHKLKLHVDGARYALAASYLNLNLKELTQILKPDALSMGGTKNGMLGAEALVVFDSDLARDLPYIRKQSLQLASKARFAAAQFIAYLKDDLWREIALHSHIKAKELHTAINNIPQVKCLYPIESNAVFCTIPKSWTKPLKESAFFYVWDENLWSIRLMTSFDSDLEEIHRFSQAIRNLSTQGDLI